MKNYKLNLNSIKVSALVTMGLIGLNMFTTTASAQTELNCPVPDYRLHQLQTLFRVTDLNPFEQPNDPNQNPVSIPMYEEFSGCPSNIDRTRQITFVHGLAGSVSSWAKQVEYTKNNYNTAAFAASYGFDSYEDEFGLVSQRLNFELDVFSDQVDDYHMNQYGVQRCQNDDYVIAHSQGGIVARNLDWHWSHQAGNPAYGTRKFWGLVTFGTPHGGAHIALTRDQHSNYVKEIVNSVILHGLNESVYDLTGKLPSFFGSQIYMMRDNIAGLITNLFLPTNLTAFHTNTLEQMKPGSQLMDTLQNYVGQLRRVVFYGEEDAPECWRVMDNIVYTKAEDYPLWGANSDESFKNDMETVRAAHTLAIEANEKTIEVNKIIMATAGATAVVGLLTGNPIGLMASLAGVIGAVHYDNQNKKLERENNHRNNALIFLNNANTAWRFLIGSYQEGDFEVETTYEVTCIYPNINPNVPDYVEITYFTDLNEANRKAADNNGTVKTISYVTNRLKHYPSDGIVLVKSQLAFPNVKPENVDKMISNNHFQMRNSLQTEDVLKRLYEGHFDPYFKIKE